MSTTYANWQPGSAVASAAEKYTELVKNKTRQQLRPVLPDQPERDAAHQLNCPSSPATSGPLTRHSFGHNSTACAFCDETPAWILAVTDLGKHHD